MIDVLMGLYNEAVHWLTQWMPSYVAALAVFCAVCFVIGVPLSEVWAWARRRWWFRLGAVERRLIFGCLCVSAVIWSRGAYTGSATLTTWGIIGLVIAAAAIAFSLRKSLRPHSSEVWETRSETAPGFPVVVWQQEVDTGLLQKDDRNRIELNLMTSVLIAGPVIGWIFAGWTGAIIGLFCAGYIAAGADRDATPPKLENVGGFVPMPGSWGNRQPSEHQRRIDAEPITETWEGQAYITPRSGNDLIDGEPHFVVKWRNIRTGEVSLMCDQPWKDLAPFELDSYEKLFGSRGVPTQYRDPWLITARTQQAGLLVIARDMQGQRRFQDLFLFALSPAFGVERRAAFLRERDAERRRRGLDRSAVPPTIPLATAVRVRPRL